LESEKKSEDSKPGRKGDWSGSHWHSGGISIQNHTGIQGSGETPSLPEEVARGRKRAVKSQYPTGRDKVMVWGRFGAPS